ncbi:MAG TPA: RNA polymerase sigma factor [Cyclobacteriaceae bacterium]|nr:RNA polymerase sigma factor [Cyclobacteriaceae bacterium]
MDRLKRKLSVNPATLEKKLVSNPIMTDDQALISRVRNGDQQAFKMLIKQHQRLVAHMVGRLIKQSEDREEICQDVFLKVFEKISEFGFQSRLSTWIATIAYRHSINCLRRQKIKFSEIPEEHEWSERFVESDDPGNLLIDKDQEEWILKLIDRLPPQYKAVLMLYHLEGMSYAEIGSVTEMPEGTVKNYLFRARNLLKEKVKQYIDKENAA